MWWNVLLDAYQTAYEKFQQNYPQTTPRFWELEIVVPEDDLEMAARAIVQEIRMEGYSGRPQASSVFLRYLLRTRLTGIRGNRLWPEVGRYLRAYTLFDVPDDVLQRYFRESLHQIHRHELPDHRNKYVMFLIRDTGAGLTRNRLVQDFLWDATTEYRAQVGDKDSRAFLRGYMDRGHSDDLAVLSAVLEPTLLALFQMVDYANYHQIPSASEWQESRNFWRRTQNIDIDRLLPEAQEMIGEVLRDIARWSRRGRRALQSPSDRTLRLKLRGRVIRPGVVVVRFAQEWIEIFSDGVIPQKSSGVTMTSKTIDGVKRYYLKGWPSDRAAWIQVGTSRWTVINTAHIEMVFPSESIKWDNMTVRGTHCHVIQASRRNEIHVEFPNAFDGQLALQVSILQGDVITVPLVRGQSIPLNDFISGTGPFAIDVLFQGHPLELTVYGYLFNQTPQRLTVQLGQQALLQWVDRQGKVITLSSKTPVQIATIDENKFVRGTYCPEGEYSWGLEFHWKPWVSDVVLHVDGQRMILDSLPTVKAGRVREAIALEPVGFMDGVEFYVGGSEVSSDFTRFQEMVRKVLLQTTGQIPVFVQGPGWTRRWLISSDLEITQVQVGWTDGKLPQGQVQWVSLPGHLPILSLNGRRGTWDSIKAEEPIGPLGYQRFLGKISWPVFEPDSVGNQVIPILFWQEEQWVPVSEISPPPLKNPSDILRILVSLIDNMGSATEAWEVVYVFERYIRETNEFPPVKLDKVVRLMRAVKDPGAEDAVSALRLLEQIIKKRPSSRYNLTDVPGIDAKSRVFYLSLLVVNQQQLFLKGLGNPKECDKIIDAIRQSFHDQPVSFWSRLMVRYCQEIAGFSSRETIPHQIPDDPVFLSDDGLRNWLCQVYDEEGTAG